MHHLATLSPRLGRLRIPVSRDQAALLLAAANQVFLGIDIWLAHSISQSITPGEMIPIVFGPVAGLLLLVAGLIAVRARPAAAMFANVVFLASAVVGIAGVVLHLQRAGLPAGALAERLSTRLLVWGPPFLGPLMFVLIALWGISAAWVEDPADSGILRIVGRVRIRLPLAKTQVYFLLTGAAAMIATISAVFDHARTGWQNANLWIPTVVGLFAALICWVMAVLRRPSRSDLIVYAVTMFALIVTGLVGAWLHFSDNLTSRGVVVAERFIRGAPIMGPLLFANVGAFGLIALMNPVERGAAGDEAVGEVIGATVDG
ncbi:hypothetical protein HQ535_07340 [bacterium]|nr:hypothetical protein [bacterium]